MIRIGVVGGIGSGKSYVSKSFGFPLFNADVEVAKLYKKDKSIFVKLKKVLPKYFNSFPVKKKEVADAILANNSNLKKIIKIIHTSVKKKLQKFLKANKKKKVVILDIPLLLENKLNKKRDILIFVQSKPSIIHKKLKKRKGYNKKLLNKFKNIQLSPHHKKKKSHFIIKNDFTKKTVEKYVKYILREILK
jgi:dephospho-CoA kinase